MTGVFSRQRRGRGVMPPTSQGEVQVRSAQELRAAVASIAARGSTTDLARGAGVVRICSPISMDASLVIPAACTGLTICASGRVPVSASGVVATLFEIRAANVTIRDVLCSSPSTSNMFTAFVTMGTAALAPGADSPTLIDNVVGADRLYVEPASVSTSAPLLRGNRQTEVNASHSASVEIHSHEGRVSDNVLADGGGDTVTIGASGGDTTVVGNDFGGGDITTTASDGGNTVGINTNSGTLTLHADDLQVGNVITVNTDPVLIVKTATETIQSDAVLGDDAALLFAMLANTTYRVRMSVAVTTTAAADFKFDVNGPAAATRVHILSVQTINGAGTPVSQGSSTYAGSAINMGFGSTADGHVIVDAIVENGANAGNLAFRWAQDTSTAANTSVLKGSWLEYAVVV